MFPAFLSSQNSKSIIFHKFWLVCYPNYVATLTKFHQEIQCKISIRQFCSQLPIKAALGGHVLTGWLHLASQWKKKLWFHLRFSWFLRLVFFRFHFWFLGFGFSVSASVSVLVSLHDDAFFAFVVELRVGRFGQLTSDLDRLLLGLFFWAARLRGQLSHGRFDRFLSWRDLHWIHFGRHFKFW